ncbi:MAG: PEP-CTERM system TPR-repeat protein PrsT [Alphaproteobacteria bacterium]|nr:PEP-CTERM system TPR-repeat protein PrsT [Alphaproteobacteria bacterium]
MRQVRRRLCHIGGAFMVIALLGIGPLADAAESPASVKNADQYIANGNLKAAVIELRNAIREAPGDARLRARLARLYLQLGDPISAEREARAAREHNGAEADYLPVLAEALLRQGKFEQLTDLVRPGNRPPALESQVRWALGMAAAGQHDMGKAQTLLQDAVRLDPKAAPPKIGLARLTAASNPAQANKLLDEVLAANPRSIEALQVRGELARAKGDVPAAMSDFDAALRIDPQNVPLRLSRANLNLAQGKYKAADGDLDPILKANPSNFMANYLRAFEEVKQKEFSSADHLLSQLSPGFEQFPTGYFLQGAVKLQLGQYAQAEAMLGKYLGRARGDARAARLAALAALRQNAPTRAIDYLKPLAAQPKADAATLTLLGNAYMASGKADLALQQFEKAAAIEPNNPAIQTRVAISEIGSGQGKQGLAELEHVFGSEAGAPVAGPTLVLAQLRAGQPDKAAQTAGALLKRDAKNALYLSLSGMVKAAQKDAPGAEAAFRAALAQDPDFAPARTELAALDLSAGRVDEAKQIYQAALAKKPDDVSLLLGLANIAIRQQQWPEATDYINRARTAAPNDPAPGMAQLRVYALQRDWSKAAALAGALSAQFPANLEISEAQAQAQLAAGDKNGALTSYKRAYALAPDSELALSRYLTLLVSAKYYREAAGVLREAIERNPGNSALKTALVRVTGQLDGLDAAISLANFYAKSTPDTNVYTLAAAELYENAGRWEDATTLLENAVTGRPADDGLVTALAGLYNRTGHFDKAEALLTGRLKADPKDTTTDMLLAAVYLGTNRTTDARKAYEALLAQKPNDLGGLLGLADVAIAEKKWPEAADDIKRAAAAAPANPAPGIKLVNLYIERQDWKDAVPAAAELAAKFPSNVDVLDAQARAQIGSGDVKGGITSYKQAHELASDSAPILFRYVAALNAAKDYTEAQSVLRTALNLAPQNSDIKANLIRVAAEIGGVDAGLAEARELAKKGPDNPIYDLVSADLLEKAGRSKEAIGLLEHDLAAKPGNDDIRAALAGLYKRSGNPDKAETLLNARLRDDPSDYLVGTALASLYLENKNYDAAISQYNRLLATHPTQPAILNNLAWLYQQKGDLNKAQQLAQRAVARAPNAPQIDDTLGWILLAQGNTGKAVTYLTAANSSAPADPAIAYHLAVALHRAGRQADAQAMLEKLLGSGISFADKLQAEKLLAEMKHS